MILSAKDARNVVYGDGGWKAITDENIVDHNRWSIHKQGVFKHVETEKYYLFEWSVGATEYQDEQPFEYDTEYEPVEVEKKMVMTETWVPVSKG